MPNTFHWQLHWLEAEGDLGPWRETIASEIKAAWRAVAHLMPPPRLDILVHRLAGAAIPEIGIVGHAYRKGLFALTVDPDNPHFAVSLANGAVQRAVAHEVHHCLRMAGPGYGHTLGEALVSEGLAGHFTQHLFASPPEPWESAADDDLLRTHFPSRDELVAADYDHEGWFFGAGGRQPRWLGYALGYRIVGDWLAGTAEVDADTWVNALAAVVLAAVRLEFPDGRPREGARRFDTAS